MQKEYLFKELKTLFFVIFFTFVYSLGFIWFLDSIDPPLFSVGVPGLAQVIKGAFEQWFNIGVNDRYLGMVILIINIPILILGYFGVSKKFTIYSLVSVLIQTFVVGFIPRNNFGLTADMDRFGIAVIGGLMAGIGVGGALRSGASLGGLDIVSQYVSLKKGMTVGYISLIINITIAVLGGIIYKDASLVAFTGIAIIITTLVTDKIHTAYQFLRVEIVTEHSDEIIENILTEVHRGATLIEARGGYKKREKKIVIVGIATYELAHLKNVVYKTDAQAFVFVVPVRHIYGNFKRKTIT